MKHVSPKVQSTGKSKLSASAGKTDVAKTAQADRIDAPIRLVASGLMRFAELFAPFANNFLSAKPEQGQVEF